MGCCPVTECWIKLIISLKNERPKCKHKRIKLWKGNRRNPDDLGPGAYFLDTTVKAEDMKKIAGKLDHYN